MSTTVGGHSGAGPLSLMSCVRESSPLQDYEPEIEKNVVSKRKFWNPRKWFRKKQKTGDDTVAHPHHQEHRDVDGARSRSTGELSTDEEPPRSNEVRNSTSMHPGLSVSHDSVFHPLNSGSSDLDLDGEQSSSSLSISQPLGDAKLQTELSSRLRLRRREDTSEDDEGLPRSPLCGSPAATTDSYLILEKTGNKDLPTKSHSTCSDGSLLSMDSSEMDEDSLGIQSRHSSKVSLNDKRIDPESDLELGPSFSTTPLNHSAAHHRVSVRPKRTYGAPRRKKGQLSSALPATPEVNEESSIRSISPESTTAGVTPPTSESFRLSRSKSNAGKSQDDTSLHGDEREEKLSLFERLFPRRSAKKKKKDEIKNKEERIVHEEKMATMEVDGDTQTRVTEEKKTTQAYSATPTITQAYSETKTVMTSHSHTKREESKPVVAPRTGAAARQRIQPIDIPASPKETRSSFASGPKSPLSPERSFSPGTSPIHLELENLLKHRQMSQISSSPKESLLDTPPQSPKSPKLSLPPTSPLISKKEYTSFTSKSNYTETKRESTTSTEEIRHKVKIAGLSSLQQRVLSLNSSPDENDSYKFLTEFPVRPNRAIAKSHSFKSQKTSDDNYLVEVGEDKAEKRKSITKAASLDSVKNLEEPILKSELTLTIQPSQKITEKEVEVEEIEVALEKTTPEIVELSPKIIKVTPNFEKLESLNKFIANEVKHSEKSAVNDTLTPSNTVYSKISSTDVVSSEPKVPNTSNTSSPTVVEEHSVKTITKSTIPKSFSNDSITISGPSHTAIVNVTSSKSADFSKNISSSENEIVEKDGSKTLLYKENQVSVTKIQLKHETTQVTKTSVTLSKSSIPEFLNKQLNKVEARPTSNIIFSMKSPKVTHEETQSVRPKTLFNFPIIADNVKSQMPRKFSKDDVEIIEKDRSDSKDDKDVSPPKTPPAVTPTTPTQSRFKKNDSKPSSRKSSVISLTPDSSNRESIRDKALKSRSISLDSLKGEDKAEISTSDKSSQDSLDKLEKRSSENVVLRRRSLVKQKNDEEPELMKVFARRSLKLKDSDVDQIQEAIAEDQRQRESDKENDTKTTPEAEKKVLNSKDEKTVIEEFAEPKTVTKQETKTTKQPLTEIKKSSEFIKNLAKEEPEVQLRRSLNNNIFLSTQRTASLSSPKTVVTDFHIKKQASLNERRKTDQWINVKNDESIEEKKTESDIITKVSNKTEEIRTETKNFSQRRAEWEKRVQQAQK